MQCPVSGCNSLPCQGCAPFRFHTSPIGKKPQRKFTGHLKRGKIYPLHSHLSFCFIMFSILFSHPSNKYLILLMPGWSFRADAFSLAVSLLFSYAGKVARSPAAHSDMPFCLNTLFMFLFQHAYDFDRL